MTKWFVLGGGALLPTIVLTGLLCYGLAMLPELQRPAPAGSLTIEVSGVRWWWRVHYRDENGQRIETANEIRLPVDQPVEFKLSSEDVIHSFWIPSLGGKVDMIPGRQTRLKLHPTRTGFFRGACAEFCGDAHAQMNFDVIVMPRDRFDAWLAGQRRPASTTADELALHGQQVFDSHGCGACHTIRGTTADGVVGPDLTHFGSRLHVGAGVLANEPSNVELWIRSTHQVKPGVEMPAFESLDAARMTALTAYLEQLQ